MALTRAPPLELTSALSLQRLALSSIIVRKTVVLVSLTDCGLLMNCKLHGMYMRIFAVRIASLM